MRVVFNVQLFVPFFLSRCIKRFFDAGRAHQYSVSHRNHCVGGRPHSETKVLVHVGDSETWMDKILS